jgi:hypothetical protein
VSEPIPYHPAADALLAPSHYEAFSLVALEESRCDQPGIKPSPLKPDFASSIEASGGGRIASEPPR